MIAPFMHHRSYIKCPHNSHSPRIEPHKVQSLVCKQPARFGQTMERWSTCRFTVENRNLLGPEGSEVHAHWVFDSSKIHAKSDRAVSHRICGNIGALPKPAEPLQNSWKSLSSAVLEHYRVKNSKKMSLSYLPASHRNTPQSHHFFLLHSCSIYFIFA
jgi:hypothetical protein